MAFSDFGTIGDLQKAYGIKYQDGVFVVPTELAPNHEFLQRLRFAVENVDVFSSEGSRTELIIAPS